MATHNIRRKVNTIRPCHRVDHRSGSQAVGNRNRAHKSQAIEENHRARVDGCSDRSRGPSAETIRLHTHPSPRAINMGMGLPWMASLWRDAPPAVGQRVTENTKTHNWQNPLAPPHKGWRVSLRLQSLEQYSSDSLGCLNRTLVSTGHKTICHFNLRFRQ